MIYLKQAQIQPLHLQNESILPEPASIAVGLLKGLSALDIFDVNIVVDDAEYGWNELTVVLNYYGDQRIVNGNKFPALVDRASCEVEWPILRTLMVSAKKSWHC